MFTVVSHTLTHVAKRRRGGEGGGAGRVKGGGVPFLSPRLGRGFTPGTELDLNSSSPSSNRATLAKVTLSQPGLSWVRGCPYYMHAEILITYNIVHTWLSIIIAFDVRTHFLRLCCKGKATLSTQTFPMLIFRVCAWADLAE